MEKKCGAQANATAVLKDEPRSAKALFRRGVSFTKQGKWLLAEGDLVQALEIGAGTEQLADHLLPVLAV